MTALQRSRSGLGWRRIGMAPVILLCVAALATSRGRWGVAAAAATAALSLAHASLLSDRFHHGFVRAQAATTRFVFRVLSTVLLLPVFVVIVVPAWLGRQLALPGWRQGVRGGRPDGGSRWAERTPGGRRPLRGPFADERQVRLGGARGFERRLLVVKTVACVLVIQAVVVASIVEIDRAPKRVAGGVSSPGAVYTAALRGLPWADEAERDTAGATATLVYTPFTLSSVRDYSSRYVNVHDRVRKSYIPAVPAGHRALNVWFFGGSTMFGFDIQRDDYTIASDVVRLAAHDGIYIRPRNYGAPGYVNYEETAELGLLTTAGQKPDLAVFYDGINDTSLQLLNVFGDLNVPGEPAELSSNVFRGILARSGVVPGGTDALPAPLVPHPAAGPITIHTVVSAVVDVYQQGVALAAALGSHYHFAVEHFWQPDLYSKYPLDPGERALLPGLNLDSYRLATMEGIDTAVHHALPPGVHDISDSLNHVKGPVFTDQAHINEVGGQAVAAAMYAQLKPELLRLSAGHS